jgi:hypothetical protein
MDPVALFIVCGLPFARFRLVSDPKTFIFQSDTSGPTFHWDLVHWDQVVGLLIAGLLLLFIMSGFLVRVYRGIKPAPDFNNWGALFFDGVKLAIVSILWFTPLMFVITPVIKSAGCLLDLVCQFGKPCNRISAFLEVEVCTIVDGLNYNLFATRPSQENEGHPVSGIPYLLKKKFNTIHIGHQII